ncbi:GNAT family N-acetyltransferase [Maritalea porphyrae]|jgi:putative acetyltransferase|uniref:GNAT family N-acetyltransferase n=1 Tax=Maritalea porphyrae TaxID=880732 RepID=UPI0022AF0E2F|nr:GNAT family N-acetyltransferase [Maritalea porphyrae]MCZ4272922.1 GNAT family N-acetyltransferase [Maritalea porphyrae]
MAITVFVETALQEDVRDLVAALNEHIEPLAPAEFNFCMTVEDMDDDTTTVFVARDDDNKAVGIGALKDHGDGVGEIKRMFTRPEVRGKRVGVRLLNAIQDKARVSGHKRLVLETGTGDGYAGAYRLYENAGFIKCGPVLDYPASDYSAFFEKELVMGGFEELFR